MKPLTLSIGSSGIGNLIEETTPAPFFHISRKTKLSFYNQWSNKCANHSLTFENKGLSFHTSNFI